MSAKEFVTLEKSDRQAAAGSVPHRWRTLTVLTAATVMDNNESSVVSTLFPVLQSALGLPLSALGTMVGISKIVGALAGPLWVLLARRTNRKLVLAGCAGFWGVWGIAAGFSQNFVQLLVLYAIAAAGFAGAGPIVNEILADLFDERTRGRAVGYYYGVVALVPGVIGPMSGQLSRVPDGWRYGFFGAGALCLLIGIAILSFFRDPGLGAAEPALARLTRAEREAGTQLTWPRIREVLRIRTFVLMLGQRLLSGHLLLQSFGVVFLVEVYHFTNAVAAIVLLPFGIGFFGGAVIGGVVVDRVQRWRPHTGRVFLLQMAQLSFAVVAFVATQFDWHSIAVFAVFYGILGFLVGVNPGVNRPIVMAVVPPELRGVAFALMLSVFETAGWAFYSFVAGFLGQMVGLRPVFLLFLVGFMLLNAAFVGLLYRPYVHDAARLDALLRTRARGT